jgi:hypothetical protein
MKKLDPPEESSGQLTTPVSDGDTIVHELPHKFLHPGLAIQ